MINVFQPQLGQEEIDRISSVIYSNWLGKGKLTSEFESSFANHLGVNAKRIHSTNCCSEGLFSSMKIFDIGINDEVILPTISFVGAGNAVCASGAKMVLCDVDSRTLNVRAEDIEKKITNKTKAIMLLHYAGVACDMDPIIDLAKSYNLKIIEDSACSVYSTYKGKACGTIGDMGTWSFDAMKILVCGDGGAVYLKDEALSEKIGKLMYFGLETKSGYSNTVDSKWWEFEISQYGHRSIMNDISAAMALEQLKKLPSFIEKRKMIHERYGDELKKATWLTLPEQIRDDCRSSYYFYHIQLSPMYRDKLAQYLRSNGIYTTFRYYPLHWVNFYNIHEKFENAENAANSTLCIPIHQSLSDDNVTYIISKIIDFGIENDL